MATLSLTRLAVAVGGLALSLTAGAGVASADPDLGPAINTTCNYSQFTAALNAEDPAAAAQLNGSLVAQGYLRQFLASTPGQRQQMLPEVPGTPWTEQYVGTCRSRSPTPATTTDARRTTWVRLTKLAGSGCHSPDSSPNSDQTDVLRHLSLWVTARPSTISRYTAELQRSMCSASTRRWWHA